MSISIQLPAGASYMLVREIPRLIADALHPHARDDKTRIVTHLMKLCDEPGTIPAPQCEPLMGEDWRLIETIWRELPVYRQGMSESEWQIYAHTFETSKAKPHWQLIAFWDETEGQDKMTRFLTEVQHREALRDAVDSGELIIRSSSLVPISMGTADMLQNAVVLISDLSQYLKQFGIEISTDTATTLKPVSYEAAPTDVVDRAIASILAPEADACQLREALESEGCHFIVSANEPAVLVDDRSGKSELHALKDLYSIASGIYARTRNEKIGNLMRSSGASGSGARPSKFYSLTAGSSLTQFSENTSLDKQGMADDKSSNSVTTGEPEGHFNLDGNGKKMKKSALIEKYKSQWTSIEADIGNASRTELKKAKIRWGYYDEEIALKWARQEGKMNEKASGSLSTNSILNSPTSVKHTTS